MHGKMTLLLEEVAERIDWKPWIEKILREMYTIGGTILFPKHPKNINGQRGMNPMKRLPEITEQVLGQEEKMKELAGMLKDQRDAYFIGRQLDYPTALEGALKLKEISYVHADAYYAGELKHGPIALIEKDTVVTAMATQPEVASKTVSNIRETIARGARVILITGENMPAEEFEYVVRIPEISPELAAIPSAVLLQMFAYYGAKEKGCDIDKPRNLAKSVTVE